MTFVWRSTNDWVCGPFSFFPSGHAATAWGRDGGEKSWWVAVPWWGQGAEANLILLGCPGLCRGAAVPSVSLAKTSTALESCLWCSFLAAAEFNGSWKPNTAFSLVLVTLWCLSCSNSATAFCISVCMVLSGASANSSDKSVNHSWWEEFSPRKSLLLSLICITHVLLPLSPFQLPSTSCSTCKQAP